MPIILDNNSSVKLTTNNLNFSIFCNGIEYNLANQSCDIEDDNFLSSCTFEKKKITLNLSCGKNLFEELENQNQTLKFQRKQLENENDILEDENQTLESAFSTSKDNNEILKGENQTLKFKRKQLENENDILEDENQTLESAFSTSKDNNEILKGENQTRKTIIVNLTKQLKLYENLFFVGSDISTGISNEFLDICDPESVGNFCQSNLCSVDCFRFSNSAKFLCDKFEMITKEPNKEKKCFLGF